MYKNKDKQRKANKLAMRRKRAQGITDEVSQGSITDHNTDGESVTLLKEGYIGAVPVTPSIIDVKPKRGKDIKCFADLPPDVQATIRSLSDTNEEFQRRVGIAIRYQHLFPDRFYSTGAA